MAIDVLNPAYLPAIAALTGSVIGGLTSFLSTWLAQNGQMRAQLLLNDKMRRQDLYRDFVNAGSSLFVDSLMSDAPNPGKLVALYAMVARMRTVSSHGVCKEADKVAKTIFDTYDKPNQDLAGIRTLVTKEAFDPMRDFSAGCRKELDSLR